MVLGSLGSATSLGFTGDTVYMYSLLWSLWFTSVRGKQENSLPRKMWEPWTPSHFASCPNGSLKEEDDACSDAAFDSLFLLSISKFESKSSFKKKNPCWCPYFALKKKTNKKPCKLLIVYWIVSHTLCCLSIQLQPVFSSSLLISPTLLPQDAMGSF